MKIKELEITDIGCIHSLRLVFDDAMNVLCGPNGIGKTTIIESVASMFIQGIPTVKRNARCRQGSLKAKVEDNGRFQERSIEIKSFDPIDRVPTYSFSDLSAKVLSMKVGRYFEYSRLAAIPSDKPRELYDIWKETTSGVSFDEVKGWFVHRYLYSRVKGSLSEQQISNFRLSVECFSIVHPQYSFSRVMGATNDIMVNTPNGEIFFEFLSSGFKSILFMLLSTIKEIEFRFKDHGLKAEEFDGIILIDEVEIHLHPEWQEQVLSILRNTFPHAQFILTTHSPHVVQNAEPNEIMALELDEPSGNVVLRTDLPTKRHAFKGWTVEEILYDVMKMKSLRTEMYRKLRDEFDQAVDNEDAEKAKSVFDELNELLHPKNPERKLLQLQLAKI